MTKGVLAVGDTATYLMENFDWTIKTSAYTAQEGDRILADTSGGAFTITLPSSPNDGIQVVIADIAGTWNKNHLTVDGNGNNIDGVASKDLDTLDARVELIYNTNAGEWKTISGGTSRPQITTVSSAYTMSDNEIVHADTSGSAFTVTAPADPADGARIGIRDKASNFGTNNLTLDGNGKNIIGSSTFTFDVNDWPADFEFNADRNEWIFGSRS